MRHGTLTLGVVLLGACGDSGGEVSLNGLPAAVSRTLCQKTYMCCSASERMMNPFVGSDVGSCQTMVGGFLGFVIPSLEDSVAKGRTAYHADKMTSCLAALDAQSCDQARLSAVGADLTAACAGAFEPLVAIGGDCGDHGDCIAGWCDGNSDKTLGKCARRKADGAPCVDDAECTNGACSSATCSNKGGTAPGSQLCGG
jgi:hypothetical protein